MFAQTRFSIGIGIGGPVQGYYVPPPSYAYVAPYPGPDFYWVDGYWSPYQGHNRWVNGYWSREQFHRGVYPRYNSGFNGGFNGSRDYRGGNQRFEQQRGQVQNRGGQNFNSRQSQGNQRGGGDRNGRR